MNMEKVKVEFPGLGLSFDVSDVAFKIAGIDIKWYGLLIGSALLLCTILAMAHSKKNKFSDDLVSEIILVGIPSAIVGARLYFVAFEWESFGWDFKKIIDIRSGGLAVYGGIIGAVIGVAILCRCHKAKIPFTTVFDYCLPYIPLGQAIGRWGNFFNQECFGTTTSLPWGMKSDTVYYYLLANCPTLDAKSPVHPTFLYESIGDLLIFALLLLIRKKSKFAAVTGSMYMVLYGILRFFLEGMRTDSLYIPGTSIRVSQFLSVILVVGGLVIILISHVRKWERLPLPEEWYAPKTKAEPVVETEGKADGES